MATAAFRIYIVTNETTTRLVRAQNPQQALTHVAASSFQVRKATAEDAFDAATKGVEIENYKDDAQGELDV